MHHKIEYFLCIFLIFAFALLCSKYWFVHIRHIYIYKTQIILGLQNQKQKANFINIYIFPKQSCLVFL